jgi:hypothetical protein
MKKYFWFSAMLIVVLGLKLAYFFSKERTNLVVGNLLRDLQVSPTPQVRRVKRIYTPVRKYDGERISDIYN